MRTTCWLWRFNHSCEVHMWRKGMVKFYVPKFPKNPERFHSPRTRTLCVCDVHVCVWLGEARKKKTWAVANAMYIYDINNSGAVLRILKVLLKVQYFTRLLFNESLLSGTWTSLSKFSALKKNTVLSERKAFAMVHRRLRPWFLR